MYIYIYIYISLSLSLSLYVYIYIYIYICFKGGPPAAAYSDAFGWAPFGSAFMI